MASGVIIAVGEFDAVGVVAGGERAGPGSFEGLSSWRADES